MSNVLIVDDEERIKGRYHLARSLGLSSQEALFAQQWSEQRIRDYAEQNEKH